VLKMIRPQNVIQSMDQIPVRPPYKYDFSVLERGACQTKTATGTAVSYTHLDVYKRQWDDNENRQWGIFLTNNHRKSHEFAKANRKEQSEYWNWRHAHPDNN